MKNLKLYYIVATLITVMLCVIKFTGLADIDWVWLAIPLMAPLIATFLAVVFVMCAATFLTFLLFLFR